MGSLWALSPLHVHLLIAWIASLCASLSLSLFWYPGFSDFANVWRGLCAHRWKSHYWQRCIEQVSRAWCCAPDLLLCVYNSGTINEQSWPKANKCPLYRGHGMGSTHAQHLSPTGLSHLPWQGSPAHCQWSRKVLFLEILGCMHLSRCI